MVGYTRDLRVIWALEELGLPYKIAALDHVAGELQSHEFGQISPFHQIPAIDDGEVVLVESGAILLYLAEKAGTLPVHNLHTRAEIMRWCFAALTTVEPTLVQILMIDMAGNTDQMATSAGPS